MHRALLIIAKRPAPGQTKTRLAPPLTPAQAAGLYEAFLCDTIDLVRRVPDVSRILVYLPEDAETYFRELAPDFDLLLQHGLDLGARLDHALTTCLTGGFEQAVILDSDSPTLPAEYLTRAFCELDEADGVIGPCEDGGYYLIGLKRPAPRLLRGVQMSTPWVVRDTLALAAADGLKLAQLPAWYDVDTAAELDRLRAEANVPGFQRAPHTRKFLSAIG